MRTSLSSFTTLTDTELLAAVHRLAGCERHATAALIASLAEVDVRRLYLGEGCSSLFTYCTRVLHLSEHAAYNRIEAARAARQFPIVLERLADGALTLTAVRLLAPHLTSGNHMALLDAARHRSRHDIERLVATLRPKPDVPAAVRKLPAPANRQDVTASTPATERATSAQGSVPVLADRPAPTRTPPPIQPLSPARYKLQVTLGEEGVALLRRAQALIRHRVPDGGMVAVVTEGLKLLVERLEKEKAALTVRPRASSPGCAPRSRTIPAAVRRAVWARDEGRCAFAGTQGRCTETAFLEFHHVRPYADGGPAVVENIELRCRAHNRYEAELYSGSSGGSLPWRARETVSVHGWSNSFPERVPCDAASVGLAGRG